MKGYNAEQRRIEDKNHWGVIFNPLLMQDLETALKIRHELSSVPMSDSRRVTLETSFEAVQIVLDLYAPEDYR